jgi:hypothetical protein
VQVNALLVGSQHDVDPLGHDGHPPGISEAHTVQVQMQFPSPCPQFLSRQLAPPMVQAHPVMWQELFAVAQQLWLQDLPALL